MNNHCPSVDGAGRSPLRRRHLPLRSTTPVEPMQSLYPIRKLRSSCGPKNLDAGFLRNAQEPEIHEAGQKRIKGLSVEVDGFADIAPAQSPWPGLGDHRHDQIRSRNIMLTPFPLVALQPRVKRMHIHVVCTAPPIIPSACTPDRIDSCPDVATGHSGADVLQRQSTPAFLHNTQARLFSLLLLIDSAF